MTEAKPRTLFDKIWDAHVVERLGDGTCVLYIDRHLLDEHGSPQAFAGLSRAGLPVRRPQATLAVADHNIPTEDRRGGIKDEKSRLQVATLEANVAEFGVPYIPVLDVRQGIVHVIGPELGFSLPGQTIVSGDSHASTHGALGALAFGIGASEVEHVLATQTLLQQKPRNMKVEVSGALPFGTTAKDMALAIIGRLGAAGANGHMIEYLRRDHPRPRHGGPHDGEQHVGRGGRAGRPCSARPDDVRLYPRPATTPRRARRSSRPSPGGAPCPPIPAPPTTEPSRSTPARSRRWSPGAPIPKRSCPSPAPCPTPRTPPMSSRVRNANAWSTTWGSAPARG